MSSSLAYAPYDDDIENDRKLRQQQQTLRSKTIKKKPSENAQRLMNNIHASDESDELGDFNPPPRAALTNDKDGSMNDMQLISTNEAKTNVANVARANSPNTEVNANSGSHLGRMPPNQSSSILLREGMSNNNEFDNPISADDAKSIGATASSFHETDGNGSGAKNKPYHDGLYPPVNNKKGNGISPNKQISYNDNDFNAPYYTQLNQAMSYGGSGGNRDQLLEKLNYMVHLLEEQQDEKTGHVMEELILYSFLGIFLIFIVDSFARVGKYTR
jgi:hypothetical protein